MPKKVLAMSLVRPCIFPRGVLTIAFGVATPVSTNRGGFLGNTEVAEATTATAQTTTKAVRRVFMVRDAGAAGWGVLPERKAVAVRINFHFEGFCRKKKQRRDGAIARHFDGLSWRRYPRHKL